MWNVCPETQDGEHVWGFYDECCDTDMFCERCGCTWEDQ